MPASIDISVYTPFYSYVNIIFWRSETGQESAPHSTLIEPGPPYCFRLRSDQRIERNLENVLPAALETDRAAGREFRSRIYTNGLRLPSIVGMSSVTVG